MHSKRNIILMCACAAIVIAAALVRIGMRSEPAPAKVSVSPIVAGSPSEADGSQTPVAASKPAKVPPAPVPESHPRAYLVGNVATGQIYLESNQDKALPVASMSKLITAFAATDEMATSTIIDITPASLEVATDTARLSAGESFTLGDILYPLLLDSSNTVAESIASSSDRAAFMEKMRGYAWVIGMPSSFFADPSGLSPENVASARDMFALARYLYKDRSDILAITRNGTTTVDADADHGAHVFVSTHPFVSDPRFLGGKTGRTPEAGETMITLLQIDDQPIAFIVLGSRYGEREADTKALIAKTASLLSGNN